MDKVKINAGDWRVRLLERRSMRRPETTLGLHLSTIACLLLFLMEIAFGVCVVGFIIVAVMAIGNAAALSINLGYGTTGSLTAFLGVVDASVMMKLFAVGIIAIISWLSLWFVVAIIIIILAKTFAAIICMLYMYTIKSTVDKVFRKSIEYVE